MNFKIVPPQPKPIKAVKDMLGNQWFEIKGKHFIRMGIHDDTICCYGELVASNSKVYSESFFNEYASESDCVPCLNLEEQMLVYVYKHTNVEAYGDFEMNLFRS